MKRIQYSIPVKTKKKYNSVNIYIPDCSIARRKEQIYCIIFTVTQKQTHI